MLLFGTTVFCVAVLLGVYLAIYECKEGRTVGRSSAVLPFLLVIFSIFIFFRSIMVTVVETHEAFNTYKQDQEEELRKSNDFKEEELNRLKREE